jgi:hypothetical protein
MKNNLFCILKVTEDGVRSEVGSGTGSGSINPCHGSPTLLRIPFIKLGMTIKEVCMSNEHPLDTFHTSGDDHHMETHTGYL